MNGGGEERMAADMEPQALTSAVERGFAPTLGRASTS